MHNQFYFLKLNYFFFINKYKKILFYNIYFYNINFIFFNKNNNSLTLEFANQSKFFFLNFINNKNYKKIKLSFLNKSFKVKKKKKNFIFFLNKAFFLTLFLSRILLKLKKKNFIFLYNSSFNINKLKTKLNYNIYTKKGFFLEKNLFKWKKGKN